MHQKVLKIPNALKNTKKPTKTTKNQKNQKIHLKMNKNNLID